MFGSFRKARDWTGSRGLQLLVFIPAQREPAFANSFGAFTPLKFCNEFFVSPTVTVLGQCTKVHVFVTIEGGWKHEAMNLFSWRFLTIPVLAGLSDVSPEELHLEYYDSKQYNWEMCKWFKNTD